VLFDGESIGKFLWCVKVKAVTRYRTIPGENSLKILMRKLQGDDPVET